MISRNIVWVTQAELTEIKKCPPEDFVEFMIQLRGDAIKPLLISGFELKVQEFGGKTA